MAIAGPYLGITHQKDRFLTQEGQKIAIFRCGYASSKVADFDYVDGVHI